MKYSGALLSSLALCASSALAAPPLSQQEMHRRSLASQNGNAQTAQWNAIVKQAGPDLIVLCQEILPKVTQVVVESTTSHTPVTETITVRETVDETATILQTDVAEVTASVTVQEAAQVTETSYVTEKVTSTETVDVGPTATVTSYTLGATPAPLRRALSDGTRNLWGKMWDANPTFVTAQCQGMFKPAQVTVTSTALTVLPTQTLETLSVTDINHVQVTETIHETTTKTEIATETITETFGASATITEVAQARVTVGSTVQEVACGKFVCPPEEDLNGGWKLAPGFQFPNCRYEHSPGYGGTCGYDTTTGALVKSGVPAFCYPKIKLTPC